MKYFTYTPNEAHKEAIKMQKYYAYKEEKAKEIEKRIKDAARNGDFEVNIYFDDLTDEHWNCITFLRNELKELGYSIIDIVQKEDWYSFTINWENHEENKENENINGG